mmetsp:Transcript_107308/g.313790  ORF Transcript_107308/g.313790 Transcript_107308/m.313790 type:complete len:210 (-) Transcript_107308:204-833(-)
MTTPRCLRWRHGRASLRRSAPSSLRSVLPAGTMAAETCLAVGGPRRCCGSTACRTACIRRACRRGMTPSAIPSRVRGWTSRPTSTRAGSSTGRARWSHWNRSCTTWTASTRCSQNLRWERCGVRGYTLPGTPSTWQSRRTLCSTSLVRSRCCCASSRRACHAMPAPTTKVRGSCFHTASRSTGSTLLSTACRTLRCGLSKRAPRPCLHM